MAKDLYYIYGLFDPRDNSIYCIGQTRNPESRLAHYIKDSTKEKSAAARKPSATIQKTSDVINSGKHPQLKKLVVCSDENEANSLESLLIFFLVKKGVRLTNKQLHRSFIEHIADEKAKHGTVYPKLHGKDWFVENETGLKILHKYGLDIGELALVMRRSERAVQMKLEQLK